MKWFIKREFVDKVLGMSGTKQEMENKIIELLELKDYFKATTKEASLGIASKAFNALLKRKNHNATKVANNIDVWIFLDKYAIIIPIKTNNNIKTITIGMTSDRCEKTLTLKLV